MHTSFRHATLGVVVFGLTSAFTFAPAQAAGPSWRIVHSNTQKTVGSDVNELNDIATLSNKDVWVVGHVERNGGQYQHSLAQHWNGSKWADTTLPVQFRKSNDAKKSSGLKVVATSSSKSVWAFGHANGGSYQYALHWNGKSWAVAHTWKTYNAIDHAVALSAGNVWIFGGETQFGTWHFNGKTWTKIKTPFTVTTAKAGSANDIWAVGFGPQNGNGINPPLVGHWNGKKWSVVPTPTIASEPGYSPAFTDISAASASDVWAVGYRYQRTGAQSVAFEPLALHWNGKAWRRADPPANEYGLYSVTSDHKGGIWAAEGQYYNGGALHYNGGKWTRPVLPKVKGKAVSVRKVTLVPGTTTIWGVGLLVWGGYPATNGIVVKYS